MGNIARAPSVSLTYTPGRMRPASAVRLTILGTAAFRIVIAALVGLGVDESYAASVARPLSLSYFDHPPLHFWIAAVAETLGGIHGASPLADLIVRLPFIATFALTTWLLFRLTTALFDERAGLYAVLALNVSAAFSVSDASWVLPDGPLLCASLATVYAVLRATKTQSALWWHIAGLACGLAMLSKYHGILLAAGILLYLITTRSGRECLWSPWPYVAGAIAALMFTPVIIWNADHAWISFAFQGARSIPAQGSHALAFVRNIGGQAAIITPWVWVPLLLTWVSSLRQGPRDDGAWLVTCVATVPITLFTFISLGGNPGLPHWPAPGWLFVFPLLGAAASRRNPSTIHRWLLASASALVLTIIVSTALVRIKGEPEDLVDWSNLRSAIDPHTDFVAAPSWIQAGKVAWALGDQIPVVCLCAAPHQFGFQHPSDHFIGHDAVIVMRPKTAPHVLDQYRTLFDSTGQPTTLTLHHADFTVLLLNAYSLRRAR
jgi:4-amino-4-deoxy-L-arabinose transferase-like glycosyltransferase